jgi:hypothetical protein
MIKVRLKIGNGKPFDTADAYGLVYVSADSRFEAPVKEIEKTSYPEQEGENSSNKTVRDAFDYKVTWFIKTNGMLDNANKVIANFNSKLYSKTEGQDVLTFNTVTFYNDYKKVKIVGKPSLIQEATEFWRDANGKQHDVVKVKWSIRVSRPSLCNFNLKQGEI